MNSPECQFDLYNYSEFPQHTKIINLNQIGEWVWLKIPDDVSRDFDLFQIDEITPYTGEVDYIGFVFRQCRYPWLGVNPHILNKDIGYHVYKFYFADTYTNDVYLLYLSYQIQSDSPERPYVYMNQHVSGGE